MMGSMNLARMLTGGGDPVGTLDDIIPVELRIVSRPLCECFYTNSGGIKIDGSNSNNRTNRNLH